MKKTLFIGLILLSFTAFSQSEEAMEKIEAARIALITERLELTPSQAEKFWPIYREFSEKQKSIRQEFRDARQNFDPNQASEEENLKMIELGNRIKQQQLNLEQEYSQRILEVISTRQLNNLRKAENDFREMLINRIKSQQQRRQQQQRNSQRLQERRN